MALKKKFVRISDAQILLYTDIINARHTPSSNLELSKLIEKEWHVYVPVSRLNTLTISDEVLQNQTASLQAGWSM